MPEGETGVVPEPTSQDFNRQLREIFFAIPPFRRIEAPAGSKEAFAELVDRVDTQERRSKPSYLAREILKRKLSSLLEHSPTTLSFKSYMATLFDAIYIEGRAYTPEQQSNVRTNAEIDFFSMVDTGSPTSQNIFDPVRAKAAERLLYDEAEKRLHYLITTKDDLSRRVSQEYDNETEHLQTLLPQWQAEFALLHPQAQEPVLT